MEYLEDLEDSYLAVYGINPFYQRPEITEARPGFVPGRG